MLRGGSYGGGESDGEGSGREGDGGQRDYPMILARVSTGGRGGGGEGGGGAGVRNKIEKEEGKKKSGRIGLPQGGEGQCPVTC